MPIRPRRRGLTLYVQGADGDEPTPIPGWAISLVSLLLLLSVLGLSVFGAYHYLRAQRLAAQVDTLQPDPRTRELQRAILDQQGRIHSLEDDYQALTRQVAEHQTRLESQVEQVFQSLRDLDHLADEVRDYLASPQATPAAAPVNPAATPQSLRPPTNDALYLTRQGGGTVLRPQDTAFPAIDPDPTNVALRLNLVRAQITLRRAMLQALAADLAARRAADAAARAQASAEAEAARAQAEAARQAAEAAARAKAAAEAEVARAAAEAAARRTRSADPTLAQLDGEVEGIIARLRNGEPVALQPRQLLSVPLPQDGPGAPHAWPLKGEITSPFGYRTFRGELDWHTGLDLAVDLGTPVHATQAGVVVYAGWQAGYGWCVEVGHGDGYSTLYAHLSQIQVDVGDRVAADALLALSGSSGNSTGPHLHYEVRLNGKAVNPTPYLP
ncbi:MAG: peptidoglycan DD-metalloendopeptidase family protein [Anaerolineae bacterium]|nr:peptidoglycan DD-metalloendopeptidase family protein [Anaerolineae bacterium]